MNNPHSWPQVSGIFTPWRITAIQPDMEKYVSAVRASLTFCFFCQLLVMFQFEYKLPRLGRVDIRSTLLSTTAVIWIPGGPPQYGRLLMGDPQVAMDFTTTMVISGEAKIAASHWD